MLAAESSADSATALITGILASLTAALNLVVAWKTERQSSKVRQDVLATAQATDTAVAGLAASVSTISDRFATTQEQMTRLHGMLGRFLGVEEPEDDEDVDP